MKIDKLKIIEKELGEDFKRTNELALTVKEDLENGDATMAEYGTYIRCCIKRINLIMKTIESLTEKSNKIEELYKSCSELKANLESVKSQTGTKIDDVTFTTCNAIIKSSIARYAKYIPAQEIQNALNVI